MIPLLLVLFLSCTYIATNNNVSAFQLQSPTRIAATNERQHSTYLQASSKDDTDTKKDGGDNKAMDFLRKVGRVGGAANMDFANAMGLDESPSGGTKSSYHEGGFKVSSTSTSHLENINRSCIIQHDLCNHLLC